MPKARKKKNRNDFYFDDCAVCQYQKKMDEEGHAPTIQGLLAAFNKANKATKNRAIRP